MIQSIFSFIVQGVDEAFFWLRAIFLNVGIDIVNFIIVCVVALFVFALVTNSDSGLKRSYRDNEPSIKDRLVGAYISHKHRPSVSSELSTGHQLNSGSKR